MEKKLEILKKVGTKILVEGTKVVTLGAGSSLVYIYITEGKDGLKNISVDQILDKL